MSITTDIVNRTNNGKSNLTINSLQREGISGGRSFTTNSNDTMLTSQSERVDQIANRVREEGSLKNWTHGQTAGVGALIFTPLCIGVALLTWPVTTPIAATITFGTAFGASAGAFLGYGVKGFGR